MHKAKNYLQLLMVLMGISNYAIMCATPSQNTDINQLRLKIDQDILDNSIQLNPSIQILKTEEEGTRLGVCHNYAISKILNLEGRIPETMAIIGTQDWHEVYKFTENYCREVSIPQPGDIITYHNDNNCPMVQHTGLVHSDGMIESKWGSIPYVFMHPTFNVPSDYGNHVKYHRPIKSNDKIIEDMNNKIPRCGYAKRECSEINQNLIYHAERGNNYVIWNIGHRSMCASIEATNTDQQTLLMIAAKTNNTDLATMLRFYNADINKQDKNGKTALHLAAENDNLSMIPILLEYPHCNKNLKDHSGNEAFDYCYEYQNLAPLHYALKRCAKPTKMAEKDFWYAMNS